MKYKNISIKHVPINVLNLFHALAFSTKALYKIVLLYYNVNTRFKYIEFRNGGV